MNRKWDKMIYGIFLVRRQNLHIRRKTDFCLSRIQKAVMIIHFMVWITGR